MGTDIETAATKVRSNLHCWQCLVANFDRSRYFARQLGDRTQPSYPWSDATASSVAAMFKALDQSQRIDVLNAALGTLGGTAEKVAEQTVRRPVAATGECLGRDDGAGRAGNPAC